MIKYYSSFNTLTVGLYSSICDLYSMVNPRYKVFYLPAKDNPNSRFLRIEGKNGLFDSYKPVGSIDLVLDKSNNQVVIDWWMVNDTWLAERTNKGFGQPLTDQESTQMSKLLFDYAENFAKSNHCDRIKRDVHQSLREYNGYLKDRNFLLTGEKAHDHSSWLQTFKTIN